MHQNYQDARDDENLDAPEDAWWGALALREDNAEHELERLRAWG